MPAIHLKTSVSIENEEELLKSLSKELSSLTSKPESYVMSSIEESIPMTFGGSADPCCYLEVKSIGAIHPEKMSNAFCKIISSKTGIPISRIYIEFSDVEAKFWGWNGSTFG
tara:strand:- start:218 stop:553 length:336 start_codon:yes stop_codon:yes gene_type:complete